MSSESFSLSPAGRIILPFAQSTWVCGHQFTPLPLEQKWGSAQIRISFKNEQVSFYDKCNKLAKSDYKELNELFQE